MQGLGSKANLTDNADIVSIFAPPRNGTSLGTGIATEVNSSFLFSMPFS